MDSSGTPHFLLIHGAWHGAWCWDEVARLLRDGAGRPLPAVSRLTPHPLATYLERVPIPGPPGAGPATIYVACTDPVYTPLNSSRRRARQYGWRLTELTTGHDAMISAPGHLAELLRGRPAET